MLAELRNKIQKFLDEINSDNLQNARSILTDIRVDIEKLDSKGDFEMRAGPDFVDDLITRITRYSQNPQVVQQETHQMKQTKSRIKELEREILNIDKKIAEFDTDIASLDREIKAEETSNIQYNNEYRKRKVLSQDEKDELEAETVRAIKAIVNQYKNTEPEKGKLHKKKLEDAFQLKITKNQGAITHNSVIEAENTKSKSKILGFETDKNKIETNKRIKISNKEGFVRSRDNEVENLEKIQEDERKELNIKKKKITEDLIECATKDSNLIEFLVEENDTKFPVMDFEPDPENVRVAELTEEDINRSQDIKSKITNYVNTLTQDEIARKIYETALKKKSTIEIFVFLFQDELLKNEVFLQKYNIAKDAYENATEDKRTDSYEYKISHKIKKGFASKREDERKTKEKKIREDEDKKKREDEDKAKKERERQQKIEAEKKKKLEEEERKRIQKEEADALKQQKILDEKRRKDEENAAAVKKKKEDAAKKLREDAEAQLKLVEADAAAAAAANATSKKASEATSKKASNATSEATSEATSAVPLEASVKNDKKNITKKKKKQITPGPPPRTPPPPPPLPPPVPDSSSPSQAPASAPATDTTGVSLAGADENGEATWVGGSRIKKRSFRKSTKNNRKQRVHFTIKQSGHAKKNKNTRKNNSCKTKISQKDGKRTTLYKMKSKRKKVRFTRKYK